MGNADFEIYLDVAGKWRWRLRLHGRDIVADSGQGYVNKADCVRGIHLVRNWATRAEIIEK